MRQRKGFASQEYLLTIGRFKVESIGRRHPRVVVSSEDSYLGLFLEVDVYCKRNVVVFLN